MLDIWLPVGAGPDVDAVGVWSPLDVGLAVDLVAALDPFGPLLTREVVPDVVLAEWKHGKW